MGYDFAAVEKKWQKYWEENQTFKTDIYDFSKPKFYALDMFPYPSGVGLHAGHPEGYTATDIVSRMKRMQGFNVLHPMGYDSFGLPAENAAIKHGIHPDKWTMENIADMREQLKTLGLSFDWDREIATSTPEYYKFESSSHQDSSFSNRTVECSDFCELYFDSYHRHSFVPLIRFWISSTDGNWRSSSFGRLLVIW